MKSTALFSLLLISSPLKAQWRIIHKSGDIDSVYVANKAAPLDTINPIILIEPRGVLSKFLIVRYAHSRRKLIAKKSVWGFTDSTNAVWRYYNGDLCRVVNCTGSGVDYAIYRTYARSRTSRPEVYYVAGYSRTLDSKIEATWEKAMEDIPPNFILPRKTK